MFLSGRVLNYSSNKLNAALAAESEESKNVDSVLFFPNQFILEHFILELITIITKCVTISTPLEMERCCFAN